MKINYSIEEILSAIDEINSKNKEIKNTIFKSETKQNDFAEVPKNTLKLIEEAEKSNN